MSFVATAMLVTLAALRGVGAPSVVDVSELERMPVRIAVNPPRATEGVDGAGGGGSDDVRLMVTFNEMGRVKSVEVVSAAQRGLANAAVKAVQSWVFERAYHGGKAVSFRLPVTIPVRPGVARDLDVEQSAVPVYAVAPGYPEALKGAPRDGVALVDVQVDAVGQPGDAVVVYASHPEFAEPARTGVLGWDFDAAVDEGQARTTRTQVLVGFSAAEADWTEARRERKVQMSFLRSYDDEPVILTQPPLVYPYEALVAGRRGGVTISVIVDPEGQVVLTKVEMTTSPEFGEAARACLVATRYQPARKKGRPVFAQLAYQYSFNDRGEELRFDDLSRELIAAVREGTAAFPGLREVDERPRLLQTAQPVLPPEVTAEAAVGEAVIDFVVDRNGRSQLIRIVRAASPEIGAAAATAVAQWRFEPATKGGARVDVRARQTLRFSDPAGSEGGDAASAP